MNTFRVSAIANLCPHIMFSSDNNGYVLEWDMGAIKSGTPQPSESEITAKIAELEAQEPIRLLREQRNQIISATDWQASSDLTMTAEQTAYRQSLRDLPSTASPALDENGELTGVTWPVEPS